MTYSVTELLSRSQWRMVADYGDKAIGFIASSLYYMKQIEDNSIPTMATDGKDIFYNREYTLSLEESEIDFVRIHECLHRINKHHLRRGDRDPKVWNFACDYVINPIVEGFSFINHSGDGRRSHEIKMPKGGLLDPMFIGKSAEWTYDYLMQNFDKQDNGEGGVKLVAKDGSGKEIHECPWGQVNETPMTAQEKVIEGQEIDQEIMASANQQKSIGKGTPNFVKGLLDKIKQSKVSWQDVLRRFIGGDQPDDYSFRKPNKKVYHNYKIYAPTVLKVGAGDIVVACDTSGSVTNDELSQFLGEIRAISEDLMPTSVTIISCDYKIRNVIRYEQGEEIENLNTTGRSGTRVSPVFRYLEDENIQFDTLVYMSDLWIDDYPKHFDKPLLWVGTAVEGQRKPPIGEVTYITK